MVGWVHSGKTSVIAPYRIHNAHPFPPLYPPSVTKAFAVCWPTSLQRGSPALQVDVLLRKPALRASWSRCGSSSSA